MALEQHIIRRNCKTVCCWQLPEVNWYGTVCCIRIRRSEHISPALISLHWLHVPEHISLKLAVLTYRSIHGTAPRYLQSCFTRVADVTSRERLWSSSSHHLAVLRIRLSTDGKWAFSVSGATVWNDHPPHVISAPSLAIFRQCLKSFLFSLSYLDIHTGLT